MAFVAPVRCGHCGRPLPADGASLDFCPASKAVGRSLCQDAWHEAWSRPQIVVPSQRRTVSLIRVAA